MNKQNRETLGTVHTHTHTHTQVKLNNKVNKNISTDVNIFIPAKRNKYINISIL